MSEAEGVQRMAMSPMNDPWEDCEPGPATFSWILDPEKEQVSSGIFTLLGDLEAGAVEEDPLGEEKSILDDRGVLPDPVESVRCLNGDQVQAKEACANASTPEADSLRKHVNRVHKFSTSKGKDRHLPEGHQQARDADDNGLVPSGLSCPDCGKVCWSRAQLESHRQQHSKENISSDGNRAPAMSLEDEEELLKEDDSLDCKICGQTLASKDSLRGHIRTVHHLLRPYRCGLCSKLMWSTMNLKAHLLQHTNERMLGKDLRCDYCGETLPSHEKLLAHAEEMHVFQCPDCPKHFQTTRGLTKHFQKFHGREQATTRCKRCSECFKSVDDLKSHTIQRHPFAGGDNGLLLAPNSPLREAVTITKIPSSPAKKVPQLLSSPAKPISYPEKPRATTAEQGLSEKTPPAQVSIKLPGPCTYCSSSFKYTSADHFHRHVQDNHPYKCPHCSKMVKLPTSIRKHFRIHHPAQRAYFCRDCTMVFKTEKGQEAHRQCWKNRPKELPQENSEATVRSPAQSTNADEPVPSTSTPASALDAPEEYDFLTGPLAESEIVEIIGGIPGYEDLGGEGLTDGELPEEDGEEDNDVDVGGGEVVVSGGHPLSAASSDSEEEENSFPCKICDDDFDTEADLAQHVAANHPFDCPICKRPYKDGDSLRKHGRIQHGAAITVCKVCVIAFTDPETRELHFQRVHQGRKRIGASGQQQTQPPKVRREEGSGGQQQEGALQCPFCPKTYAVSDSMRKHARTVHGKAVFTCTFCMKTFGDVEMKRTHLASDEHRMAAGKVTGRSPPIHHGGPEVLASTPNSRSLLKPRKDGAKSPNTQSSGSRDFVIGDVYHCLYCPRTYDVGTSCRKHSRKVHGKSQAICKFCPGVFKELSMRDKHVADCHSQEMAEDADKDAALPQLSAAAATPELEETSSTLDESSLDDDSLPPSPCQPENGPTAAVLGPQITPCQLDFSSTGETEIHTENMGQRVEEPEEDKDEETESNEDGRQSSTSSFHGFFDCSVEQKKIEGLREFRESLTSVEDGQKDIPMDP